MKTCLLLLQLSFVSFFYCQQRIAKSVAWATSLSLDWLMCVCFISDSGGRRKRRRIYFGVCVRVSDFFVYFGRKITVLKDFVLFLVRKKRRNEINRRFLFRFSFLLMNYFHKEKEKNNWPINEILYIL